MHTVHFDESANQSAARHKNPHFTKRKGNGVKGTRRGYKMTTLQALDKTKQARAYELIKDPDKHAEIIALCEKDPSVEIAIVGIVNLLRGGKELEEFAENGLTNIIVGRAENEPLPAFNDLPSKVKYLLANLLDVKKFAALANHPSENTSLATVFTVPFDDVDPVDERIVTHLLFRVAFREANAYGTSLKGFEDACSKIFREDSKYYKTAYECVTKDAREAQVEIVEGLNADIPAALDNTWLDDTIEKFLTTVLTLNAAQEQANNDEASANSQATYYNKMQTATKSTLIKYCALNNRPEEVIELNTKIFKHRFLAKDNEGYSSFNKLRYQADKHCSKAFN